jgi:uncharacterized protein YyaL (SSP411 family)
MEILFRNELHNSSSLYLRQHANNPVHWQMWSESIFEKAIQLDKPILLSIGYSACHWCHVMEHESFEDDQTAAFMNAHFINVKVDREERPDLDDIFMEALQALTGSGGWPLNMFLTSEGKPFYGGTYFPPKPAHGKPSWLDVLAFIHDHWKNKRTLVLDQAEKLTSRIEDSNTVFRNLKPINNQLGSHAIDYTLIRDRLLQNADVNQGGFGDRPKFPQFSALSALMHYAHYYNDSTSLHHAFRSLEAILQGGIYDQLGGGLSRYSTDEKWFAPHFEKMLYDNALLIDTLSDAYRIEPRNSFKKAIIETIDFLEREMKDHLGGYYAAIDADSEGEEGAYYVWTFDEIESCIGAHRFNVLKDYWGIKSEGNWEGKNILSVQTSRQAMIDMHGNEFDQIEMEASQMLFNKRQERIRPNTDTKIILSWNALLLKAFTKAYAALTDHTYFEKARSLYEFLTCRFIEKNQAVAHQIQNDHRIGHPFLEDVACLMEACMHYQQISGNQSALDIACQLANQVIKHHQVEGGANFYFASSVQTDLLLRKVNLIDSPMPSGNSIMFSNLFRLARYMDRSDWEERSEAMQKEVSEAMMRYPLSFSNWIAASICNTQPCEEWVITGMNGKPELEKLNAQFAPHRITQSFFEKWNKEYPLAAGKKFNDQTNVYKCVNGSCQQPTPSVFEILKTS